VVQIYFRHVDSPVPQPRLQLCGFQRIHLEAGESRSVAIAVPAQRFRSWDASRKSYGVEPGGYELLIGAASDDIRQTLPIKIAEGSDHRML
jgi:beta-glucosidase